MSLAYSDTSGKDGILQRIETKLGFPDADITGNTTKLARFTGMVNLALDKVFHIIFKAAGTAQFDDNNHTAYPVVKFNLVANQRDYSFTQDADSNLILAFHKVAILPSSSATRYEEIDPFSEVDDWNNDVITETTNAGVPSRYGKLATGLFLDPMPSYSATNGLKVYVDREASYFLTSDTTKKPGFAGLYHDYLVLAVCYDYALANTLKNRDVFKRDMLEMEKQITEHYSRREKDKRYVMTPKRINYI